MKIAIILNPWFPLPVKGYGGIERFVFYLSEELVRRGHKVKIYTVGTSKLSAQIEYIFKKPIGKVLYENPYIFTMHLHHALKDILKNPPDIIHLNTAMLAFYYLDLIFQFKKIPTVITLHTSFFKTREKEGTGMIKFARLTALKFKHFNYISISNKQREAIPELNYVSTIYHGIPIEDFTFNPKGSEEIVWLGRIYKAKGLKEALEIALRLNLKLKIAYHLPESETEYFNQEILPLLSEAKQKSLVKDYGEMKNERKKSLFLGKAKFFLFPLTWDEPFGLVVIEALASGTPVIAYARGALPEIIENGKTGFLVDPKEGIEGMIKAIKKLNSLSEEEYLKMRLRCRKVVEERFTVKTMTDKYLEVFKRISR